MTALFVIIHRIVLMNRHTSDQAAVQPTKATASYDQIEAEFEAIKQRYRSNLGPSDVAYIKGLRSKSRWAELLGRGLLWFGHDPLSFGLGVLFTWLHRNLESIEIGHNVLHGQYDYFPEIPQFHSRNFKWKAPVDEEGWRREPWVPFHRWQVPSYLILGYPIMLYGFNSQNLGFREAFRAQNFPTGNEGYAMVHNPGLSDKVLQKRHKLSIARVLAKEYVAMPLLALATGYSAGRVALGNLLADLINSYWISLTIQATHFTAPLQPEDALRHKGHWYVSQLDSSVNFRGPRFMSTLWGHLNYQIEHHLFPDIPSRHYPAMAREVKAICARHGLNYQCNPSWWRAISNYVGVMWKYSLPPEQRERRGGARGQQA